MRIVGVALVVALPIWAFRTFDDAVTAEPTETRSERERSTSTESDDVGTGVRNGSRTDTGTGAEAGSDVESDAGRAERDREFASSDIDGDGPRYLAFGPAKQVRDARVYRVADLPGLRDRDIEPDEEERAYPIETDLVAGFSLAPVEFIEPGLYASSFAADECSYELRRVDRSGHERPIGQEHLRGGRLLVSINAIEPDVFTSIPQCRSWKPWSPLAEPLVRVTVGDYWIDDLARGLWSVPDGCLWEKVVGFRGARLADVTDSGRGPAPLVIDEDTLGVRVRDCELALVLIEAEAGRGIAMEPGLQP